MNEIPNTLTDFFGALHGVDTPGDDTCEICGRDGIRAWQVGGVRTVRLCAPCLGDDLVMQLGTGGGE